MHSFHPFVPNSAYTASQGAGCNSLIMQHMCQIIMAFLYSPVGSQFKVALKKLNVVIYIQDFADCTRD